MQFHNPKFARPALFGFIQKCQEATQRGTHVKDFECIHYHGEMAGGHIYERSIVEDFAVLVWARALNMTVDEVRQYFKAVNTELETQFLTFEFVDNLEEIAEQLG